MASGDTKTEAMLNVLGNGGSGDQFRGCCNTKTQQYILDAIDRINNIQPGGSYTAGDGIDITSNTISVDTDTIQEKLTAGTNITIADNVISAAGGSAVKELTSADYNYPVDEPVGVALWLLDAGLYRWGAGTVVLYQSSGSTQSAGVAQVWDSNTGFKQIEIAVNDEIWLTKTNTSNGSAASSVYPQRILTNNKVFRDTSKSAVQLGNNASSQGDYTISIGYQASTTNVGPYESNIAIGRNSRTWMSAENSVALGFGASASSKGQFDISTSAISSVAGYNDSAYRLLTGVYDGQSAHDAVTVGQVNGVIDAINTALSTNIPHIGA